MFRHLFKYTLLVAIALLAIVAIAGCAAVAQLGPMGDAGEAFMKALSAGDTSTSYNLLAPSLQNELGGEEGWKTWSASRVPTKWNFTSKSITNDQGLLEGTATFTTGENLKVSLVLIQVNSAWKVAGIDFSAA